MVHSEQPQEHATEAVGGTEEQKTLELEVITSTQPDAKTEDKEDTFKHVFISLLKSAATTLIQQGSGFFSYTTLIFFVSLKKDPRLIGCLGLGVTLQYVFVTSFIVALNVGLSTVGSQAYGAGNPKLLGLYFKRAQVIVLLVAIPMAILLANSSSFFYIIGVDKQLSESLQGFLVYLLPSSVMIGLFDAGKNYLVSQKIFGPQSVIQLISMVIDISIQYTLTVKLDLGFPGIGLGRFCDEAGKVIMLYTFISRSKRCKDANVPWSRECFKGLWGQFKDQLSAGGLMILDIFGAMFVRMQTAYLGPNQQAADVIGTRINNFCMLFTWSLQIAIGAFIGNSVGEQNEKKYKRFTKAGLLLVACFVSMTWLFMGTKGHHIAIIFSEEPAVVNYVEGLISLFMIISPVDTLQGVLGAILRSSGKGKALSKLYMVTYYPVSIPLSILLAHKLRLGIYGLYSTILIVKGINAVTMLFMLARIDLKKEMKKAVDKVRENEKSMVAAQHVDFEEMVEETNGDSSNKHSSRLDEKDKNFEDAATEA